MRACSKSSKLYLERRVISEHFCCSYTLPLLIKLEKLIQISVLISLQVRYIQSEGFATILKSW